MPGTERIAAGGLEDETPALTRRGSAATAEILPIGFRAPPTSFPDQRNPESRLQSAGRMGRRYS